MGHGPWSTSTDEKYFWHHDHSPITCPQTTVAQPTTATQTGVQTRRTAYLPQGTGDRPEATAQATTLIRVCLELLAVMALDEHCWENNRYKA